jgi:hypothetical protein
MIEEVLAQAQAQALRRHRTRFDREETWRKRISTSLPAIRSSSFAPGEDKKRVTVPSK